MVSFDVIITSDRTMMSNHHGKEFLGFVATGPPIFMPEWFWMWLAAPKMKVDKLGRPWQAPYGLRKIEAALQNNGINAAIIDPDYIKKYLNDAKVLAIGHHDYFALGPPSSEWWVLTGKEPINARSFRRFMEKPEIRRAKERGLKIIVGGPAAWQWLWKPELVKKWGIDTIVEGESEKIIVKLIEKALKGEELPKYVHVGVDEVPSLEEIPLIKHASVNGLIEIMRGCPRGCKFCSVTLKPLRFYTLDMIEKELQVNVKEGVKGCILHSDDVLLYGADGIRPKPEPLIKLHELAKKYCDSLGWSHFSLSAVKYAEDNYKLITKIAEIALNENDYGGVEVGIETGSPVLARKIMPAKAAPYKTDEWPNVVKDAFGILHDVKIVPAGTLIIGMPGETPDDIMKTIELIDDLKDYRSFIVPMYFVPMGVLKNNEWYKARPTEEQLELMKACLRHDLRWIDDIAKWYMKDTNIITKMMLKILISLVRRVALRYELLEHKHITNAKEILTIKT